MAKLYGVGVGPGDPELVTVKAKFVIEAADVICVPKAHQDGESIALKIIAPYLHKQKILEIVLPMTKEHKILEEGWRQAAQKVAMELKAGHNVVFPTLGDVTIYSTFSYLTEALQEILPKVNIEMIPGITSFSAAAARMGISLADGNQPLVIVPEVKEKTITEVFPRFNNLVLLKVSSYWQQLKDVFAEEKVKTALVSRLGQADEAISEDFAALEQKPDYLTLAIVKRIGEIK